MTEQMNYKNERINPKSVTASDKMDVRDCARLLDYYRIRVGNKINIFFLNFFLFLNTQKKILKKKESNG